MGKDIIAGMNLMGYDAMAIGPMELEMGASTLRQRVGEAEFPILSANVLWGGGQGYVGAPYTILQVGPYRIGVIGLTRTPETAVLGFTLLDPGEVLAKVATEVGEQVDTVILLTNLSYRSALDLAQVVPGIDLVIAALPRQLPDRAVRAPQTGSLVVTAEQPLPRHTGRRVGKLHVVVDKDGALRSEAWATFAMGPEFADDLDMRELLDEYR